MILREKSAGLPTTKCSSIREVFFPPGKVGQVPSITTRNGHTIPQHMEAHATGTSPWRWLMTAFNDLDTELRVLCELEWIPC